MPHAVANPDPDPAELLTFFGPQGERLHVRARPRRQLSRLSGPGGAMT